MHIPWNEEYIKQCVQQWVLMQVSTGNGFFLMHLLPNEVKKIGFLNLCRLFQNIFIRLHKKSYLNFVMPTGLPGEEVESIWGFARSYMGGLAKVLFGCRAIFFNCFALCDNLLGLSSPGKLPQVCGKIPQPFLCSHLTSGLRQKPFSRVFWEISPRKHGFLGKFFSPDSLFFT